MVVMCEIPNREHRVVHKADVNWRPLSVVMWLGMPYQEIQEATRASAHNLASIVFNGAASNQRVVRSIIVYKYVLPSAATGRGPTKSMCMCKNHCCGTAIGYTAAAGCVVTFPLMQDWQSLIHLGTSEFMPLHTSCAARSRRVRVPGWANPWMAAKTCHRFASGTKVCRFR